MELSKTIMYDYLYEHLYAKYDYKNVTLCYMDTDSFILSIKTDDFYADMVENRDQYDLSEYSENHPVYQLMKERFPETYKQEINKNKKVVGLMKDECGDDIIESVIAIRSKVYCYRTETEHIGKRLKGIKKLVTDRDISY